MNHLLTDATNHQLICLKNQGECCSGRSIVKALDNFLSAVQKMKDTVMVPSRLRDISACVGDVTQQQQQPQTSNNAALALFPRNGRLELSLYNFYRMLHMIRNELVSGPTGDLDDDLKADGDETVRQLSAMFQQHLQGLFSVLHQLTDAANYLTKRYQEDLTTKVLPPPF